MRHVSISVLIVAFLLSMCNLAVASEVGEPHSLRYIAIYSLKAILTIEGNTANCYGLVTAKSKDNLVDIVMKLIKVEGDSEIVIQTWRGSGIGTIGATLRKNQTVSSGTYFLRVTGTVKTPEGVKLEVKSKDSAKVTK